MVAGPKTRIIGVLLGLAGGTSMKKWLKYYWACVKWAAREPSPPVAAYDNTPDKYEDAHKAREQWLSERPKYE